MSNRQKINVNMNLAEFGDVHMNIDSDAQSLETLGVPMHSITGGERVITT